MLPAGVRGRLNVNIKQKSFRAASGGKLQVLGELAFSLGSGQVAALVGPSGCGKTTLLRIVAGLDRDFEGDVALPAHGTLGMVFQEPRLLPWRTVEQNVRLAAPRATDAALDTLFQMLGLKDHRHHYPGELSLGLARRVALARAFAVEPDLLLLDEPFVSLDDALAARLREELAELVNRRPVTTLLVTHNVEEAVGLADRLLLLSVSPARILADLGRAPARSTYGGGARSPARRDRAAAQSGFSLRRFRPHPGAGRSVRRGVLVARQQSHAVAVSARHSGTGFFVSIEAGCRPPCCVPATNSQEAFRCVAIPSYSVRRLPRQWLENEVSYPRA
jgi:ABC-type nitrate/sulfonate/bicarbonate transport system ATPase subunit